MDDDEFARKKAELDQAVAGVAELASATATYRDALIEAGMDEETATVITCTWVAAVIGSG